MSEVLSPRWTKKRRLREMAAKARDSKRLKMEATRASHDTVTLDDSLVLPVESVIQEQDDVTSDGSTFSEDDAMTNYKEWISCQPKERQWQAFSSICP